MPLRNFFKGQNSIASIFLQGHALRDPLTAIRWGTGTLRKAKEGSLSEEERAHMLDEVYFGAKTLTTLIESMMLMAEIERAVHIPRADTIKLKPLIQDILHNFEQLEEGSWQLECKDMEIMADEKILRYVLLDILTVRTESLKQPLNMLIKAEVHEGRLIIEFFASLIFPVLQSGDKNALLAGSSALLLSLAHSLAGTMNASIMLEKKVNGNFIPIGDTDEDESASPANHYKIVFSMQMPVLHEKQEAQQTEAAAVA